QLEAAKLGAVGITGMRANGNCVAQSLLDSCRHGVHIAGVAATSDVDRGDRAHQRLLGTVCNGVGHLAHVAIEVDAVHSIISSLEASSSSCSISKACAVSQSMSSNRISSRGRNCATLPRSAEITLAIFG